MKLLLVDLDDTLINTKNFSQNLFAGLADLTGLSIEEIRAIYGNVKDKIAVDDWESVFIENLSATTGKPVEDLQTLFDKNIEDLTSHNPVVEFVKEFEGKKVIFTLGNKKFQWKKLDQLALADLVDEVIVTPDDKFESLEQYIFDGKVVLDGESFESVTLIDDNLPLLEKIRSNNPWINVIDSRELLNLE